jgi:hypothetical protein
VGRRSELTNSEPTKKARWEIRIAARGVRRNFRGRMNTATATIVRAPVFKFAGLRTTTVLLAVAWVVPVAVHLVPWAGARPLGAWLMPALWTVLVAAYLFGKVTAVLTGLFVPVVNWLTTGQPAGAYFWKTSVEAVAFALLVAWAVRRSTRAPMVTLAVAAPLAYAVAKTLAAAVATPAVFGSAGAAGEFFARIATGNWPGLVVLAAGAWALARFFPKAKG